MLTDEPKKIGKDVLILRKLARTEQCGKRNSFAFLALSFNNFPLNYNTEKYAITMIFRLISCAIVGDGDRGKNYVNKTSNVEAGKNKT